MKYCGLKSAVCAKICGNVSSQNRYHLIKLSTYVSDSPVYPQLVLDISKESFQCLCTPLRTPHLMASGEPHSEHRRRRLIQSLDEKLFI